MAAIGKLHSIETFGTVDGPGVRFVVFFQGCPLRCRYCHNPDTHDMAAAQLELSADEVLSRMTRNLPFYKRGGITATGGEPLLQIDFLTELFTKARGMGIHTCLDTSGIIFNPDNTSELDTLLGVTDLVMLDIKHIDDERHRELTGSPNHAPLSFLAHLDKKGVSTRIRHVLVPGFTDGEEELRRLGEHLSSFGCIKEVEVLPYHTLGVSKYENLGIPYTLSGVPDSNDVEAARAKAIIESERLR